MCFYGIASSCFYNLINDFICLWLGERYLLSTSIIILIIVNFYISGMRQTCQIYNTTLGLFWNDRFKPWVEAGINLIASIALIHYYGFTGVLLGTFISTVTTSFWVEPYILYKHGFNMELVDYFVRYGMYTTVIIFATGLSNYLTCFIEVETFAMWIIKATLVAGISVGVVVLCFFRTHEFIELYKIGSGLLRNAHKK